MKLARREYVQQAHKYADHQDKIDIAGWYASEKLDGFRGIWDGGLSRGQRVGDVPYASKVIVTSGKPKPHLDKLATGLWSRYGNPIWAPDYFLNQLPSCLLDGELWAGRGNFQTVSKTCKRQTPDEDAWRGIEFKVFGSPNPFLFFQDGHAKSGKNIDLEIRADEIRAWMATLNPEIVGDLQVVDGNFIHELSFLTEALSSLPDGPASLHQQVMLSADTEMAISELDELNEKALAGGAEGMVVRDPQQVWTPKRVNWVLKVKPCEDMEGEIVGFTSGEETDKGSKLLGKFGAAVMRMENGLEFNLSGFRHEERVFAEERMKAHATDNPGVRMPADFQGKYFKTGQVITFKYREFTEDGLPKEARYFRKHEVL